MAADDRNTEERILDAAHAVFVRQGTAGARMQGIADEAGVNKALLHYYFRSKDALARAVFRRAALELFPPVLEVLRSEAPIEEKVERVIQLELDQLSRNPFLPGYILSELNHHPERAPQLARMMVGMPADRFAPEMFETLGRQLDEGARQGRIASLAPEQFLVNLVSLCIFPFAGRPLLRVFLDLDEPGFAAFIEERKESLPDFFLRALRP